MNYKGEKPCPGCRRTAGDLPRSRADEVCPECLRLLELGRGVKEQNQNFSQIKLAKYSTQAIYTTDLSKTGDGNPIRQKGIGYVPDTYDHQGSSSQLMKALEALILTLDDGIKNKYDFRINIEDSFPEIYSVKTLTALALVEFLEVIRLYGNRREAEGFERGHHLLVRLCDGSLSIDDFNRQSVKDESDK
jgi:hypothetical protein